MLIYGYNAFPCSANCVCGPQSKPCFIREERSSNAKT